MVIKINYTVSPVNINVVYGPITSSGLPPGGTTGQVLAKDSNDNYDTEWINLDLTGLVPYTGATTNVDLGEFEIKAGQVEFDQTPTGTAGVGVMRWNDTDGTVDLGLKGGNVTLQVGQEQVLRVVNKTGADLLEAQYRAVRIRLVSEGGAQGQRLAVVLAQGNNDPNSTTTIGIVTETITNNQEGFITTSGMVRGINTTGSLQGETWADGDIIYLSPTVAGAITKVKPTAPNHSVTLGYVVYAHANNGKIFVKVDNGYEIGELHDVYVPTPSNNDGIFWNTTNSRYQNNTIAGVLGFTPVTNARLINTTSPLVGGGDLSADRTLSIPAATTSVNGYLTSTDWTTFNSKQAALGYTPVPTTRTLTINGTAYDLSADRSWSVGTVTSIGTSGPITGGTITGSGTIGITQSSGSTDGYLSSTDWTTFNGKQAALTLTTTGSSGAATLIGATLNIPQYSGGGGMAIGGSITSATAGSVLFAGTSGVLQQDNANLFWDDANNRLGIGTATPAHVLDVTGNSFLTGNAYLNSLNTYIQGGSNISFYAGNTLRTRINTDGAFIHEANNNSKAFSIAQNGAGTFFEVGNSNGNFLKINTTGNIGINQTTDGGYKLDVTGTTRFAGNSLVANPMNANNELKLQISQSNRVNILSFANPDNTTQGSIIGAGSGLSYGTYLGNQINVTGGTGGIALRTNNAANIIFYATNSDLDFSTVQQQMFASTGNVHFQNAGTYTDIPSARVAVNSTTQGFLPPRMTTVQRDAITSPATGLQVYNTTTNENNTYNGSAWVGGGSNIYTASGSLTSARAITLNTFNLDFIGSTHTNRFTAAGRLLLGTTTESTFLLDVNGTARVSGDFTIADTKNIILATGTGTKIGTATTEKLSFWNATPIVQPTTGIAEAAFVENSGGTAVNVDSTFDGYTIQQIAKALRNAGLLA